MNLSLSIADRTIKHLLHKAKGYKITCSPCNVSLFIQGLSLVSMGLWSQQDRGIVRATAAGITLCDFSGRFFYVQGWPFYKLWKYTKHKFMCYTWINILNTDLFCYRHGIYSDNTTCSATISVECMKKHCLTLSNLDDSILLFNLGRGGG